MRSSAALVAAIVSLASIARAGQIEIQHGATLSFSAGALDAGCADLSVSGVLDVGPGALVGLRTVSIQSDGAVFGGTGRIRAAGNWNNFGLFSSGTGTVEFVDGCALTSSAIRGNNVFASLTVVSSTGKTLFFQGGTTQTTTGVLRLTGVPGNRLLIRSTIDGTAALLDAQGAQQVEYVDVKDNHAVGAPIYFGPGSVDSGNTNGWFFSLPIPAFPALGLLGALLGSVAIWRSPRVCSGSQPGGAER